MRLSYCLFCACRGRPRSGSGREWQDWGSYCIGRRLFFPAGPSAHRDVETPFFQVFGSGLCRVAAALRSVLRQSSLGLWASWALGSCAVASLPSWGFSWVPAWSAQMYAGKLFFWNTDGGNPPDEAVDDTAIRSIPAWVGEPSPKSLRSFPSTVYPRVGGGTSWTATK